MEDNFSSLFQYLEKKNINISHKEFEFQAKSHPDYPSLLSFSDTLSFFNIENGVFKIPFSEINNLPTNFVTILKGEEQKLQLNYIEKNENKYYSSENNTSKFISSSFLESKWNNIVLLVEKGEKEGKEEKIKNYWVLRTFCILLLLITIFQSDVNIKDKFFFCFPVLGIFFSVVALKDLFGAKSKLINNFCNLSTIDSCSNLVKSNKWKFFEILNFSDLSIMFFSFQFIGLYLSVISNNENSFFSIQKVLLFSTFPIIVASLYYQKFVEKKWCPICLTIIGILIFELFYILLYRQTILFISDKSIAIFSFTFVFIILIWFQLKKNIEFLNETKEFKFKANRFYRNYEIFKNNLVSNTRTRLAYSPIILGNGKSNLEITIITSPFCGYCKDAHDLINKILILGENNFKVKVIINADITNLDEEKKVFFRILMSIYIEKGANFFNKALSNWFNNKNLKKWIKDHNTSLLDIKQIDAIYEAQNQWCIENNSYFTPAIFINNFPYPKIYERESLFFFINDLIDDEFFSDCENDKNI